MLFCSTVSRPLIKKSHGIAKSHSNMPGWYFQYKKVQHKYTSLDRYQDWGKRGYKHRISKIWNFKSLIYELILTSKWVWGISYQFLQFYLPEAVCAALTILVLMHDNSHNAVCKTRKQCAQSTFTIILALFVCKIIPQFNFTKAFSCLDTKWFCNLFNSYPLEGFKVAKVLIYVIYKLKKSHLFSVKISSNMFYLINNCNILAKTFTGQSTGAGTTSKITASKCRYLEIFPYNLNQISISHFYFCFDIWIFLLLWPS